MSKHSFLNRTLVLEKLAVPKVRPQLLPPSAGRWTRAGVGRGAWSWQEQRSLGWPGRQGKHLPQMGHLPRPSCLLKTPNAYLHQVPQSVKSVVTPPCPSPNPEGSQGTAEHCLELRSVSDTRATGNTAERAFNVSSSKLQEKNQGTSLNNAPRTVQHPRPLGFALLLYFESSSWECPPLMARVNGFYYCFSSFLIWVQL